MKDPEFKEIIEVLRSCPGMSTVAMCENIAIEITKQHRTHQANVVRNMLKVLETYGKLMENRTDLRNENAVSACLKIKDMKKHISYI